MSGCQDLWEQTLGVSAKSPKFLGDGVGDEIVQRSHCGVHPCELHTLSCVACHLQHNRKFLSSGLTSCSDTNLPKASREDHVSCSPTARRTEVKEIPPSGRIHCPVEETAQEVLYTPHRHSHRKWQPEAEGTNSPQHKTWGSPD